MHWTRSRVILAGATAAVVLLGGSALVLTTGGPADAAPPDPPNGLTVYGLTCDQVTLSWSAPTDDTAVAFYDVYHDGQQMLTVDGSARSADLTVVPGVPWGLYVNARDAAGNVSQASETLNVTPPPCQVDSRAPTAPANLVAEATGTSVTLRWTAATDNVRVTAYEIQRGSAVAGTVEGAATTFIDSGLSTQTTYTYRVVARDAQNNRTPSPAVSVRTGLSCTTAVCTITPVATDRDIPWGLVSLPDGAVLYARRDAHDIVRLDPATGAKASIGSVPNAVSTDGEGGLLGLAVAADFTTNPWLYVYHTSPTDNRVVRIRYRDGALSGTPQLLVTGIPRNKFHDGGRLRFGPDGKLYASTGDGQNGPTAQDTRSLGGKILRLNPDGSVPADNPFGNYVWSYGHRNPQGLAFDSKGRLWEQEFGNSTMDETNLIQRGGNYGWPACEGTRSVSGQGCGTPGYIAPKHTYPVAVGSCSGIAIVRDVLYVACARGARLYRELITGSELTGVQEFLAGTYGRLRTVEPAPDGGLWLTTTNKGDKDSVPDNSDEKILHVELGAPT